MKLEIEVPEVACCRCSVTAALAPTSLRRGEGANSVVDSKGDSWVASGGGAVPQGWTTAPGAPTKLLCNKCTEEVSQGIADLLKPSAPLVAKELVKTAAASIPTLAPPPVIGRVINSGLTPGQKQNFVSGGAWHGTSQYSRPAPTVSAAPKIVQPSAVSRPIAATLRPMTQPSVMTVSPPKIHAPIRPAERGSNVVVASNTTFPQPLVREAIPVPARADVPRSREVAVQDNAEVEPQGPVTLLPVLRGTGV